MRAQRCRVRIPGNFGSRAGRFRTFCPAEGDITERVVCGVAKRFRQRPVERSRGPTAYELGLWGLFPAASRLVDRGWAFGWQGKAAERVWDEAFRLG